MNISVGRLTLPGQVLLAPMSGITDRPFRGLVQSFGPALVFSEMIASREMVTRSHRTRRRADRGTGRAPVAVQLAGRDPTLMAEAAKQCEDEGAPLIDINMGCPVKKVVGSAAGSALLRDLGLARQIIEATVAAVTVPVTLKMRTGWDDASRNAPELARIAEDCGVQMLTVHGRTRCQFYQGRADWHFIRRVKEAVRIAVIANGDIDSGAAAAQCLEQSGADGVMVGRAVRGRPWLVQTIERFLSDGAAATASTVPTAPNGRDLGALVARHYESMLSHYGVSIGVRVARKHLAWYAGEGARARGFINAINRSDDPGAVLRLIAGFFAEPAAAAA